MNKAQTARATSVVRTMAERYPDHTVSFNPNLVINSLGQKIATFIFTPTDGSEEIFVQENIGNTIKTMLWNIEDDLESRARMAALKQ